MSNPRDRVTTEFNNTRLSAREITVRIVLLLLLPKLDKAIRHNFPPSVLSFSLILRLFSIPVYPAASTGLAPAAILPGFLVLTQTVSRLNNTAPAKIAGFGFILASIDSILEVISGSAAAPAP